MRGAGVHTEVLGRGARVNHRSHGRAAFSADLGGTNLAESRGVEEVRLLLWATLIGIATAGAIYAGVKLEQPTEVRVGIVADLDFDPETDDAVAAGEVAEIPVGAEAPGQGPFFRRLALRTGRIAPGPRPRPGPDRARAGGGVFRVGMLG